MTDNTSQIAGAALEEAVLVLLSSAGFQVLEDLHGDPTLDPTRPPVTIRGRGAVHQIDAVADPVAAYAFSNPARLLIEAKAYRENRTVSLQVVRNAVGTVKDLSEFWRPTSGGEGVRRYHYRYAIFSTSGFSKPAQEYAFAQDVYLLPLRRSAYFKPVVAALDQLKEAWPNSASANAVNVAEFRRTLRAALRGNESQHDIPEIQGLVGAVRRIENGLIAVADRQFPIFLIPSTPEVMRGLDDVERVRIRWTDDSWFLEREGDDFPLFSFDLPDELFRLYASAGGLGASAALRLKSERLGVIQAVLHIGSKIRIVSFKLDQDWVTQLREGFDA